MHRGISSKGCTNNIVKGDVIVEKNSCRREYIGQRICVCGGINQSTKLISREDEIEGRCITVEANVLVLSVTLALGD